MFPSFKHECIICLCISRNHHLCCHAASSFSVPWRCKTAGRDFNNFERFPVRIRMLNFISVGCLVVWTLISTSRIYILQLTLQQVVCNPKPEVIRSLRVTLQTQQSSSRLIWTWLDFVGFSSTLCTSFNLTRVYFYIRHLGDWPIKLSFAGLSVGGFVR